MMDWCRIAGYEYYSLSHGDIEKVTIVRFSAFSKESEGCKVQAVAHELVDIYQVLYHHKQPEAGPTRENTKSS